MTHRPGVAVVDAADHQPQSRPLGVGGHEPEGRHALEHRFLDPPVAPDLEEMVHQPDRVEPDVVRLADDSGERRPDRLRPAGPGERADLETDLHVAQRTSCAAFDPASSRGDRPAGPYARRGCHGVSRRATAGAGPRSAASAAPAADGSAWPGRRRGSTAWRRWSSDGAPAIPGASAFAPSVVVTAWRDAELMVGRHRPRRVGGSCGERLGLDGGGRRGPSYEVTSRTFGSLPAPTSVLRIVTLEARASAEAALFERLRDIQRWLTDHGLIASHVARRVVPSGHRGARRRRLDRSHRDRARHPRTAGRSGVPRRDRSADRIVDASRCSMRSRSRRASRCHRGRRS